MNREQEDEWHQPVMTLARRDIDILNQDLTVEQALKTIRERGVGEKIVYFYVVDGREQLTGVLPTRRLLSAPLDRRLADIMVRIGTSVLLTLCAACFFGLTVPAVLHAFRLDPKIAAGPVTLAFTDIFTLFFYFSVAALLL